ncbi:ANTAR domain-containing protein [Actinokineospora sp. PR83]|uniref:ANTAR domain-containing protein n=1 Tax=Actinokineospora sp. PR83 TaxID=2884908 RepID=UPI001F18845D|nr:ANTAR domain-containing protein [Actinokineospora sp. PR83]MCG8916049.1 ANTAR domain-containing protein [Actinokineospora sp. PR83]
MPTADDTTGGARVRAWVAERAAELDVPVSVPVLCDTAVLRLGVSGATQTVELAENWPQTVHATDGLGARLADLHVTVGEGPCLDVWRDGGPVLVPELDTPAAQRRWPLFAPSAVSGGAAALFAFPLAVGAIRVGVLALHLTEPRRLAPATLADAVAFAHLALQLHLDTRIGHEGPAPRLHDPQLHQATGMVSAQLEVGVDEAFTRLRARAFAEDRPLTDLAADVVARRLRFDPADEAG